MEVSILGVVATNRGETWRRHYNYRLQFSGENELALRDVALKALESHANSKSKFNWHSCRWLNLTRFRWYGAPRGRNLTGFCREHLADVWLVRSRSGVLCNFIPLLITVDTENRLLVSFSHRFSYSGLFVVPVTINGHLSLSPEDEKDSRRDARSTEREAWAFFLLVGVELFFWKKGKD